MPGNITARHEATRAGIVKMETNPAEIPKNQQIQSLPAVGWFVPSRGYCSQCRYLLVCSAAGVGGARARSQQEDHGQALRPEDTGGWGGGDPWNTGQYPGAWTLWDHAAAELPSCPRKSPWPAAAPFGADTSPAMWRVTEGVEGHGVGSRRAVPPLVRAHLAALMAKNFPSSLGCSCWSSQCLSLQPRRSRLLILIRGCHSLSPCASAP